MVAVEDKAVEKSRIERQLIPRLKILGFILIFFAAFALVYSFFPEGEEEEIAVEEDLLTMLSEPPPFNLYIVAIALGSVGITCIAIAWRKKKNAEPQAETSTR
jgi:hypothetical protein